MLQSKDSAIAPDAAKGKQSTGHGKQTPYSYQEQKTDTVLPQIDSAHIPQITDELARIPERLQQRIWCCFKIEPRADGRMAKVPYSPSGYPLSGKVGSPEHRSRLVTCEEALRAWKRQPDRFAGVGFFTDKSIGIILADFDNCYDALGRLKPYIKMVLSYLRSYTEESFSGKGKHCLFFGRMPEGGSVFKEDGIELYDTHFVVWTGQMDDHYPAELCERQEELEALHQDLVYRRELRKNKRAESSTEVAKVSPSPSAPPLLLPDDEIVRRAERMRGEAGEIFRRLHKHGDISGFPHGDGTPDPSRADYNYFRLIAFWCHRDPIQMERIGRKSALYRPDRWNNGDGSHRLI